jgi:hydroxyacylglutathione hydrolase
MRVEIHQFPCLDDNYGFLLHDGATGDTACIDAPDARAIMAELERRGWSLKVILNTHWHRDHAGGNATLRQATGASVVGPAEVEKIAPVDLVVSDGDVVALGTIVLQVIGTPGHTLGHVCYFDPAHRIAFVGDTLFALGCGRLFEGTAKQMWGSLNRLAALPGDTKVYCAHEYTLANARFALSVDDSAALRAREREIAEARRRGEPTVPTTIEAERATNPFLRASGVEHFARLRQAKDAFRV